MHLPSLMTQVYAKHMSTFVTSLCSSWQMWHFLLPAHLSAPFNTTTLTPLPPLWIITCKSLWSPCVEKFTASSFWTFPRSSYSPLHTDLKIYSAFHLLPLNAASSASVSQAHRELNCCILLLVLTKIYAALSLCFSSQQITFSTYFPISKWFRLAITTAILPIPLIPCISATIKFDFISWEVQSAQPLFYSFFTLYLRVNRAALQHLYSSYISWEHNSSSDNWGHGNSQIWMTKPNAALLCDKGWLYLEKQMCTEHRWWNWEYPPTLPCACFLPETTWFKNSCYWMTCYIRTRRTSNVTAQLQWQTYFTFDDFKREQYFFWK